VARHVLGHRPIVVAVLSATPLPPSGESLVSPRQKLCGEIADVVPTNIVIVYAHDGRKYDPSFCTGPGFANPDNPVKAGNFDFPLIAKAETAWHYRVSDAEKTPQIEEYVLAFDAQAAQEKGLTTVPRRAAVPDRLATGEIVLSLAGIVFGCIAVFLLLHLLGRAVAGRSTSNRRRVDLGARLSRIGDRVLRSDSQDERQAELARRYVLALRDFDDGRAPEREIAELEEMLR
jgi:hypothetical protein